MAPIKFEESLKESLEKRTIAPSDKGWDELSARLDASQDKNKRSAIFWWSIAATVVILLGLTIALFPNKESGAEQNKYVETEQRPEIQKADDIKESQHINPSGTIETTIVQNEENQSVEQNQTPSSAVKTKRKDHTSDLASTKDSNPKTVNDKALNPSTFIKQDPSLHSEVVETISRKDILKTVSAEAEADSLLKSAQKNIVKTTETKNSVFTVDANSLLQDVEGELEESFRTKMFETLMDGVEVVKTRVAQRNN